MAVYNSSFSGLKNKRKAVSGQRIAVTPHFSFLKTTPSYGIIKEMNISVSERRLL